MFARVRVPKKSAALIAGRRQQAAVGAEVHRFDVRGMPHERAQLALCSDVPDLDRVISAARGQQFAVTAKHNLRNSFAVPLDGADLLARGCVPKEDLANILDFDLL